MKLVNLSTLSLLTTCILINGCQSRSAPAKQPTAHINSPAASSVHKTTASAPVNTHWQGTWERSEWQNGAELDITAVSGNTFTFDLQASSGGHSGDIEDKATINGNKATFVDSASDEGCQITFTMESNSVISVVQQGCLNYGGVGVTFNGKYTNVKSKAKQPEKTETLVSLKVFTPAQDAAFKNLVDTDYVHFVNSTQLTYDEEDLDGLHAKVQTAAVRGLSTLMENIIMVDSANHIWAAVIDDEKVNYYTNDAEYKSKLPKTIEKWRSRFMEYPVHYTAKL